MGEKNYRGKVRWNLVGKINGNEKRGRGELVGADKRLVVAEKACFLSYMRCTHTLVTVPVCANKVRNTVTVHIARFLRERFRYRNIYRRRSNITLKLFHIVRITNK